MSSSCRHKSIQEKEHIMGECSGNGFMKELFETIGKKVDEIAQKNKNPKILSLGTQGLEEARYSAVLLEKRYKVLFCIDYMQGNLDQVKNSHQGKKVKCACMSIVEMIDQSKKLGSYDLIYSPLMYNYLESTLAYYLTESMYEALKPGGVFLAANFLPGLQYEHNSMICFNYRDINSLKGFIQYIPDSGIQDFSVYANPGNTIGYLELVKKKA